MTIKGDVDFLIIGSSGMQGRIVTRDLLEHGFRCVLADLYEEGSRKNMERFPETTFQQVDLRDYEATHDLIARSGARVVVNCAEGDWNVQVYRACLQAGVHVLDLGSDIPMTKEQIALHDAFVKKDLVAITGCGSTPGINNVMLAHATKQFSHIETIEAGFAWDSNIKEFVVPFSIESIIEELTDGAAVLRDGTWAEVVPTETEETREFRVIGKQRCFIVRHPETYTFKLHYEREGVRNIRFYAGFPEHSLHVLFELIKLGLGEKTPIDVDGHDVRPVDAVSRALTRITPPEGYEETENLWIMVEGRDLEGRPHKVMMECIVPTLPDWREAGCNIDTGMPCSIMAQMVLDGRITKRGSFAPGSCVPSEEFLREVTARGMTIYENGKAVTFTLCYNGAM